MTIKSLQAGRAIAALAVVVHHAGASVNDFVGRGPKFFNIVAENGYLGVDFFFVLSGFIIYYTNRAAIKSSYWSISYFESRATRILVPYLPIGVAMAVVYSVMPQFAGAGLPWTWLTSLTLIPVGAPALTVAWTLQHEIFFYALAWALLRNDAVLKGSIAWASLIIIGSAFGPTTIPLSLINLEFLFGMCVAWCFINEKLKHDIALVTAGAVCIVTFALFLDRQHSVIFGLGLAFFILPIVRAEKRGAFSIGSIWMLLGAASYAIYLIHQPVISVLARLAVHSQMGWAATLLAMLVVSVGGGLAYYLLYEKPALAMIRRATRNRMMRPTVTS